MSGTLVAKGAGKFALVGTLTGTGGVGTGVAIRHRDPDVSNEIIGSTAGGWAGQGLYQGAGYAGKHRVLSEQRGKLSRAQADKLLKPVKREHGAFTPAMYRHYPKTMPGWRTNRVLGWTHRGKTGTAVGSAATLAGSLGAVQAVKPKERHTVRKASYEAGVQRTRTSPLRATELAAGVSLLGWGGSRLGLVRSTLAIGGRAEGNAGIRFRRAEKARQAVELETGKASSALGARLNTGFRLRPIEATVGGAFLTRDAIPVRRKQFTSTQQGGY